MTLNLIQTGTLISAAPHVANYNECLTASLFSLCRQLEAGTVTFSVGYADMWGDAYTSSSGRLGSVSNATATYSSSKYSIPNYDLSAQGSGNSFTAGKVGTSCLTMNGSGYASVASNCGVTSGNNDWSCSFWAKIATAPTAGNFEGFMMLSNGYAFGARAGIVLDYRNVGGTLKVGYYNGSEDLSSNQTLTIGTWYWICAEYTASTKQIQVFVNNTSLFSSTLGGNMVIPSTLTLKVGSGYTASNVNGSMDDFRMFNAVLGSTNRASIYNSGSGTATQIGTELVQYGFESVYSNGVAMSSGTITHTIPTGTFPSGITKAICAPKIVDWETGADIQFKLTNGTDDTGWLTAGITPSIQSFTAFAAAPTQLIVKLIPKSSSPTPGYPSISAVAVRATE